MENKTMFKVNDGFERLPFHYSDHMHGHNSGTEHKHDKQDYLTLLERNATFIIITHIQKQVLFIRASMRSYSIVGVPFAVHCFEIIIAGVYINIDL